MEKYIYFVRHGQSEANEAKVFQGADAPLTDLGRRQAGFVADRLRSVNADVILTSPMPRAQQTADIIRERTQCPLESHDVLREYMPPSSFIGQPRDTPEGKDFVEQLRHHMNEPGWHYADEDNYFDLHARAIDALAFFLARPENRLIVVTHVGFMRVLLTAMLTEGAPDPLTAFRLMMFMRPMNTGITVCRHRTDSNGRNNWRLVTWNDHAHLAETDQVEP
jgi:broad specificity phosphatase PhoE